jgi:hypothetical protein
LPVKAELPAVSFPCLLKRNCFDKRSNIMTRRLLIENLSHLVEQDELKWMFASHGIVHSVNLIDRLKTAAATTTGFVQMASEAEAESAISAMNGTRYRGRPMVVGWDAVQQDARPSKAPTGDGASELSDILPPTIDSKYGKSFDTSNGSEQPFGVVPPNTTSDGQSAKARWEDDGGLSNFSTAMIPEKRPQWSVQSLRLLNQALKDSAQPSPAEQARQHSIEKERESLRIAALAEVAASVAAQIHRNRHRNGWEHL